MPNSIDNHQFENAKFFESNRCGWVFDQVNNNERDFEKLIKEIFNNPKKLVTINHKIKKLSQALSKLRNDKSSSEFLSDLILKLTNNQKKEFQD